MSREPRTMRDWQRDNAERARRIQRRQRWAARRERAGSIIFAILIFVVAVGILYLPFAFYRSLSP